MARVVVLPSPLLGPVCYQPLADALRGRGHDVTVAGCPEPITAGGLVAAWAGAAAGGEVLVAHSNAGYLAGSVGSAAGVGRVVYVDAALPPATGSTRLAPDGLLAALGDLVDDDGRLPPWTRWWPEEEMRRLLPGDWFARVDAAAPRVDLDYFRTEHTPPQRWTERPAGYLAFGTTYAAELRFAREVGWPVTELSGHHLWHLTRPEEVAVALDPLLDGSAG